MARRAAWACAVAVAWTVASSGPAAAQEYYDSFGKNKVRYAKFDWRIYHAPHFDVHYYPEEEQLLEKVISLAESAYDSLSQELDFQIQQPTPLIIYKTHTDFLQNNIIVNFIPEGVGAFATPNLFRMVLPIDLPDPELYGLIRHELTHIFQYHILFSGSLGKSLTASPPQWFMEGMASYYGQDEDANDRMFLVDAVVNDSLPPITKAQGGGFFAYRYGHAAFDFIEDRWGKEGLRDFLYEFRNTLGAHVGRAVQRAFRITPEDFDAEFRRWLRQKYLPRLIQTGEPSDFGRPFRTDADRAGGRGSQEISPIASPSGDLVAAFSTLKNDVDLVLFDAQKRTFLRNLTKGGSTEFQNLIAQNLTAGRRMGRDVAFSPDGNSLAAFASKREAGRALVIVDVIHGGIRRIIDMEVEQQVAPAWSPDGNKIAFAGNIGGSFDLFMLDLDTLEIENLTKDPIFDGSPAFSPDGKTLVFSSVIGDYAQLFTLDLATGERHRLLSDESNDIDAIYSSDGKTIYFTSDRNGANNIYGLDIASREVRQHTNAVTGCFMPAVLPQPDGSDKLVYTGYWKSRFDLYEADLDQKIGEAQTAAKVEKAAVTAEELPKFEPDIQVTLDDANKEKKKGFKLFLEDAGGGIGVDNNQTFLGQVYIQFSDFFGDRRLLGIFSSVDSFSNFYVNYTDMSRRTQRVLTLFDERDYFQGTSYDPFTGFIDRGAQAFRQTGATAGLSRPFSFYRRGSLSVGFISRDVNFQSFAPIDPSNVDPAFQDQVVYDSAGNAYVPVLTPRKDTFPIIEGDLVGDTAVFGSWGPHRGHRWRLAADYAPNISKEQGQDSTLELRLYLDAREYLPTTQRSGFAFRLFAGMSDGDFPQPFYFGGLDTVRGFDFRELVGDRAFYANIEWRFPLIDLLATPILNFQGIRGRLFFDIGGAWFKDFQSFRFYNSDTGRLQDAVAAYGFGITIRFFGLPLNWDFAKTYDFKSSSDTRTSFWIGERF